MLNSIKSAFTLDLKEARLSKTPVIMCFALVYLATLYMQIINKSSLNATIGFSIVMVVHLIITLFSYRILKYKYWLYFGIQGIFMFDYAVIMGKGYEPIFLWLIPIFIFQSMIVYNNSIKTFYAACFFYGVFCGTIIIYDGVHALITYIPILILITTAIRSYATIFLKQVKSNIQTQKILKELELTYEKVEELTLVNERQRVARDLHDTLSQGLAGIIMQLEAVNANLNKNNVKRAQEIVEKSMEHARKTLADARFVIDDLRLEANSDLDFIKLLNNEIAAFKAVSNTSISENIRIEAQIPLNLMKQIVYIVREALSNIAKHAEANNTVVEIVEKDNQIYINIIDDGIGFDIKLLDQLFGHYGIMGMTERVKAIHGEIKIKSKRRSGTTINITIPFEKGIYEENE